MKKNQLKCKRCFNVDIVLTVKKVKIILNSFLVIPYVKSFKKIRNTSSFSLVRH